MFAPFSLSAVLPALRAGEMLLMACGASKDQGGAERLAAVMRQEALAMGGPSGLDGSGRFFWRGRFRIFRREHMP